MLRLLRRIVQRAPLLVMILLMWLVLTVLAFIGRRGAYSTYSTEHGRLPGLSVVMRGIHDHVYPWSEPKGETGQDDGRPPLEDDAGQQEGTEQATADGDPEKSETSEQTGGDANASKEQDAGGQTADKDADGDTADGTQDQAAAGTLKVPETSCSKVVEAKDYGVAEEGYLSPDDTVYNTDRKGLFAPDGTYYSLQEVDDSYFADALMIGDSRTVGLYEYGDMADVTSFLARESTTIYDLFDDSEKMEYTPRGKDSMEQTLKNLLSKAKFKKIYISVGVNELGVPDTKDYYMEFRKVVARIHKMQPDAIIYIQGIMHVSKKMSSTDPVYNNKAIVQRNKAIATLANGRNIFYIDMNADLCDENGDLKAELTGDGIHLKAAACDLWHAFLRRNAIVIPGVTDQGAAAGKTGTTDQGAAADRQTKTQAGSGAETTSGTDTAVEKTKKTTSAEQ